MNSQLSATSRSEIRNGSGKLAGANIRNYPQPTGPESANSRIYPLAVKRPADEFSESSDNDPINSGNHPTDSKNPSIIHRNIGSIHRSGCRNRSIESSDDRQMIYGNRQTASLPEGPSRPLNHQLIVNRFPVIVNSAALNLSTIHQRNGGIHQPGWWPPRIQVRKSSDNHPTKPRNHPTDSANRLII